MRPLTLRAAGETTRKLGCGWLVALSAVVLGGGGCATSGPNHVYLTTTTSPAVHDLGPPRTSIAGAVAPGEQAVGLAYDFNTDHLFVRIAPAQVIRVIERPSGKILREMPLPAELRTGPGSLPRSVPEDTAPVDKPRAPSREQQGADLAIRSSDRHLFAIHPDGRSVVELTLTGEFVRRIALADSSAPIGGLAFDQKNSRLMVLTASSPARIGFLAPDGSVSYHATLQATVNPVSLGYDSENGHCFVPLEDGSSLGEFDTTGNLVATHRTDNRHAITALDAGPRSFVRVF